MLTEKQSEIFRNAQDDIKKVARAVYLMCPELSIEDLETYFYVKLRKSCAMLNTDILDDDGTAERFVNLSLKIDARNLTVCRDPKILINSAKDEYNRLITV
ncbi:hypothetical protein [Thermoactinomyces sp. CICC 10522]|uniref:hypothetical protein n=1 Tax=Thermoactinomyces sp. CICC 10522 TaxID=2767427 RepID=UPI0018DEA100|nr:hypothetical protein [Thermoactinomyces sp. CICC 10522]MBH8603673.1 hypothetical protein [Thermoactinomyces sp. CICC 10522]